MLRKELRDTLKTFVQSLMILLVIPIALLLDWHVLHSQWEISGIYQPVFLAVIIIYAVYSGVSIFQAEKRDRALEYLLSLPVSRWKIVTVKVLPRFVLLLLLLAAAGILSMFGSFLADAVSMIIAFLLAITLSLAVESMINAMVGVLLLNAILYYASLVLSYLTMEHHWFGSDIPIVAISQALPPLLLLLPLGAAFTLAVKHFDLKPLKWQARPYLLIALPGMMIMIIFVLLFIKKYLAWIKTIG